MKIHTPIALVLLALLAACPTSSGSDDDDAAFYDDDDAWYGDDDDALPPISDDPDEVSEDPPDEEDDVCTQAPSEPTTLAMSADDSNSQAQATIARAAVLQNIGLGGRLRPYEFLNYYDFDYAPADSGSVAIEPQLREDGEGGYTMLVGVVAPHIDSADRRPLNLTFSIDTSCSMGGDGMTRVRETLEALDDELREGDVVSVSTWASAASVRLDSHAITGPLDSTLSDIASSLGSSGSTNLEQGLATAYQLASDNFLPGRLNRVVFLSDGGANAGITSQALIADHAEDGNAEGIYLVAVGAASVGDFADPLMDQVSDLGKGSYVFLDRPGEADRMFTGDRMLSTLEVAARDVQLSVTLPSGFILDAFHGEEVSTDPTEVTPQHLAPNDSMLYHFTLIDCDEEAAERTFDFEVSFHDPETRQERVVTVSRTLSELLDTPRRQLEKADVIVAYAEVLTTAENRAAVDAVIQRVDDLLLATPGDLDLVEISAVLTVFAQRF